MLSFRSLKVDDILIVNRSGIFGGILFEIGDNVLYKGENTYRGKPEFWVRCLEKKRNKFLWTWAIPPEAIKNFTKIGTLN